MKNHFLVLGGSIGQVPAIEKAQALGMDVVVVSNDPSCIGASKADYFECVDVTDFSEVERVARQYDVIGSMTMSNDLAVPTSCYVNEKLNLPMQGEGLVNLMTDKYNMRQRYAAHQVNSPQFYQIKNSDDLIFVKHELQSALKTKKFIVKPNDSSGSRGVSKITNIDELDAAVQHAMSFSPSRKVIVEEFIDGIELGALTFSIDGKMVYCFVHHDKVSRMVQIGHSFPHMFSEEQEMRIQNECKKALTSLGIKNGPCLLDIMLDGNGIPFIIEAGARLSAHKLPEIVQIHSGIDLVTLTVQLASGQKIKYLPVPKNEAVAVEMITFNQDGIIEKIGDFSSLIQKYQPIEFELRLSEKQKINRLQSSQNHYGYVIFTGENVNEAENKCNHFVEEVLSFLKISQNKSLI